MSDLTAQFLRFRGEPGIAELSADEALDEFLSDNGLPSTDCGVIAMVNELMAMEEI